MTRHVSPDPPSAELRAAPRQDHREDEQAVTPETASQASILVEVLGPERLFAIGTMPSQHVPEATTGEVNGVYVLVRQRAGRALSVVCQSVGEARKLPGFRPLSGPRG